MSRGVESRSSSHRRNATSAAIESVSAVMSGMNERPANTDSGMIANATVAASAARLPATGTIS